MATEDPREPEGRPDGPGSGPEAVAGTPRSGSDEPAPIRLENSEPSGSGEPQSPAPSSPQREPEAAAGSRLEDKPTFCDGAGLNLRKQKERNMPDKSYIIRGKNAEGTIEKDYTNVKSAQTAAGKLSKTEGAKGIVLWEVSEEGETKMGTYVDGKMSKPKGKGGITPDEFAELLGCREGTIRRTLACFLAKNINKPISKTDIQIACYGEANDSSAGALMMVMKGIGMMIVAKGLEKRFDVVRERKDGKTTYCLMEI